MNSMATLWSNVCISELATPNDVSFKIGPFGSSLKKDELVECGIPVVGIENVLPNLFTNNFRRFVTEEKFQQLADYAIKPGDILVTTMGTVGRAAVVPAGVGTAIIDSHLFRMRLDERKAYSIYVAYAINGYAQLKEQVRRMAGGAIMAGLNTTILRSCIIPLPPLEEQRRIVGILKEQLGAVERARAACEAQLEAARALPDAYLRGVFQSGEARHWPSRALRDISKIAGGIQKSPDRRPIKFHRPFLTVRNVHRGYLDLSNVERFEITPEELERLRLLDEDILLVEGNGSMDQIGRNALFEDDGTEWIHQNHVIRVRLNREIGSPRFVSLFLNSDAGKKQMVEKAKTTSGLYTLSAGKVGSLLIPVPPLGKQVEVVATAKVAMERVGQIHRRLAEKSRELDSLSLSLLRQAFSGKL